MKMYFGNVTLVSVLLILCLSATCSTSYQLKRAKRESGMSVGQIFANLLDSLLADTNTTTAVNNSTLSSTFSFLNRLTSKTPTTKPPTPLQQPPTALGNVTGTTSGNMTSGTTIERLNVTLGPTFMIPPTTTSIALDERCGAEFAFSKLCDLQSELLSSLDIWDVYGVIFSNDVIEALLLNCDSGHWCLYDEFDYWNGLMMEKAAMVKDSPIFNEICQLSSLSCIETFLDNVTGCPIQERMNFTVEAINLLCNTKKDSSLDVSCYGHLLATFHVTVVEFLRDSSDKEARKQSLDGTCRSPEVLMTKSVLCVEKKCPNHDELFLSFSPWKWFTNDIEKSREDCHLPADTCDDGALFGPRQTTTSPLYDVTTEEFWMSTTPPRTTSQPGMANDASLTGEGDENGGSDELSFPAKMTMILGVSAGGIIAFSGCFVLIYACLRKHGSPRRADKIGYQPLRNHD